MTMTKKLLGTRIPNEIIIELKDYCQSHGILINHFVTEAIKEKLNRMKKREERIKKEETLEE